MEQWKPIVIEKNGKVYDYTGIYEVSNKEGRIRSLNYNRTGRTEILKPIKNKNGYSQITLSKDGKMQRFYVHRIVAEVFIPNPDALPEVDHINRNKTDNSVENLRWSTHDENMDNRELWKRKVICIETKQVFDSIQEASNWYQQETGGGVITTHIVYCCKGKRKKAGGFHWEYVKES